jgi:hypothetical protein
LLLCFRQGGCSYPLVDLSTLHQQSVFFLFCKRFRQLFLRPNSLSHLCCITRWNLGLLWAFKQVGIFRIFECRFKIVFVIIIKVFIGGLFSNLFFFVAESWLLYRFQDILSLIIFCWSRCCSCTWWLNDWYATQYIDFGSEFLQNTKHFWNHSFTDIAELSRMWVVISVFEVSWEVTDTLCIIKVWSDRRVSFWQINWFSASKLIK